MSVCGNERDGTKRKAKTESERERERVRTWNWKRNFNLSEVYFCSLLFLVNSLMENANIKFVEFQLLY